MKSKLDWTKHQNHNKQMDLSVLTKIILFIVHGNYYILNVQKLWQIQMQCLQTHEVFPWKVLGSHSWRKSVMRVHAMARNRHGRKSNSISKHKDIVQLWDVRLSPVSFQILSGHVFVFRINFTFAWILESKHRTHCWQAFDQLKVKSCNYNITV